MPPPLNPNPDMLDTATAAARLGITRAALYELIRTGRIPTYRYSTRRIRISAADLDAFLTAHRS